MKKDRSIKLKCYSPYWKWLYHMTSSKYFLVTTVSNQNKLSKIFLTLISDLMHYFKTNLPADGYCIIGLTWVDLYPGEDWDFVLGESSCEDGCAVVSFGHFEPQSYQKRHLNDTKLQNIAEVQCCKADRTISSVSFERNGHHDVSLYLEDFVDIEKVSKVIIWRLLRVRCSKMNKPYQSVHLGNISKTWLHLNILCSSCSQPSLNKYYA